MLAIMRRSLLTGVLANLAGPTAWAGPYFNTYRTDLDSLSREAVRQLNEARAQVINMFSELDSTNQDAAEGRRKEVIAYLEKAQAAFQQIASKVGNRQLNLSPNSDESKLIVEQFRLALDRSKLPFPKTEQELAQLAVTVVGKYEQTISRADLKGFPKNWRGVRDIILSEIDLLNVGNLASIVWVISKENS
jgi:hypothetical protein